MKKKIEQRGSICIWRRKKEKRKNRVWMKTNKEIKGKNKIKNNKKLKLRNATTIFSQ